MRAGIYRGTLISGCLSDSAKEQVPAAIIAAGTRKGYAAPREAPSIHLDKCCAGRTRFLPEHCGSDRSLQAVLLPQAVPASDPVQAARPGLPHQRLYYILNPYQHHPCTVFVQMVLILCYLFSIIAL